MLSQSIETSLQNAKDNKHNLIAVLDHYKSTGEKEKHKAAEFLIANMHIHVSKKLKWTSILGTAFPFSEFDYPNIQTAFSALDSLKKRNPIQTSVYNEKDVRFITSKQLIDNIDLAFASWKNNPWSQNYSFETFCEYILPYRNVKEPLQNWRSNYQFLVQNAPQKAEDKTDPVDVCSQVIQKLKNFSFVTNNKDRTPILSPQQLLFRRQGSCFDLANLAVLTNRASGIATTFDFTPHYGASSNRHFWNTVIDTNGNHIPFDGNSYGYTGGLPYLYKPTQKRLAKVYRVSYSIKSTSLASKIEKENIPKGFLQQQNIIDVTKEYVTTNSLSYTSKMKVVEPYAYLNVFNTKKWHPIDWAKREKDHFVFKNLGRDLVYLPSFYKHKKTRYALFPILLDKTGTQKTLKPDFRNAFSMVLNLENTVPNSYKENNSLEIIDGEQYTLLYWYGYWRTIETSTATATGVSFERIPENALFLLLPKKPDRYERIFTIDNKTKKIIWY